MSYHTVPYLFIEGFIKDHKLEVYDNSLVVGNISSTAHVCIYMNHIYLYIFLVEGKFVLAIEAFPKKYQLFVLKWSGNSNDFIKLINDSGMLFITKGINYIDNICMDIEKELTILKIVLNYIISRRDYLVKRYDLK